MSCSMFFYAHETLFDRKSLSPKAYSNSSFNFKNSAYFCLTVSINLLFKSSLSFKYFYLCPAFSAETMLNFLLESPISLWAYFN